MTYLLGVALIYQIDNLEKKFPSIILTNEIVFHGIVARFLMFFFN